MDVPARRLGPLAGLGRVRQRHAVVAVALLALVGSVGITAAVPAGHTLVVTDAETGDVLASVPVEDGTTVTLSYRHSVERTPVHDVYVVRGTTLDNAEMRFQSYGWGLPADADVRREDGYFVFDPDRRYDELFVKPGTVANHGLTIGDSTTIDLVALSDARSVRLTVERRSALHTFLS